MSTSVKPETYCVEIITLLKKVKIMDTHKQEREGRGKRGPCEMLHRNACPKASFKRALKEMSMLHPKGTEGYALIEENLRRRVEMPKTYRMFQIRFERGSMRTIVPESKEPLVLEFDNRKDGTLRNRIVNKKEDWVVVVRFDSPEHLEGWLQSNVRRRLNKEAAHLWEEARAERVGGGFPGWFAAGTAGSGAVALPPNWKQAMGVLLVLYPMVMLLNRYLSPPLASLPLAVAIFLSNAAGVALLTWLLMPLVNRVFGFWLSPPPSRSGPAEALGIGAMLCGYAIAVIIFMVLG
jgi:antibiotic biosynthesis monooxygenase (ABM) superfamily enzyme